MKNFRALQSLRGWRGGVAITALGAVVLAIGLLQTTSSTIVAECPQGSTLIAKFERDRGRYDFEKPNGNRDVVTITNGTDSGGNWQSTAAISYIIVKGGPGSVVTSFAPPQTSGTFSNAGLPKVGRDNTPDISNIQFCGPTGGGTPTTTSTTTSTTKAPTTTTSTTTTKAPTTTTSTTKAPTTTTSTTVAPTTTSTTSTTSTTIVPNESTTTSTTSTTTTEVDPTTTSTTTSSTVAPTTTSTTTTTPTVDNQSVTSSTLVLVEGAVLQQSPDGSVAAQLPRTGSQSGPLVVLGIVLLGIGASFTLVSGLRTRRSNG